MGDTDPLATNNPMEEETAVEEAEPAINPLDFPIHQLDQVFTDVEPIPQDDGPSQVCCIDYPPNFIKCFDYFRAVLKSKEISPRVFGLTGLCLDQNSSNYTVWHVRRACLLPFLRELEQKKDDDNDKKGMLQKELEYTATLGGSNPKSYQVWYHRRSLLALPIVNMHDFYQVELDYIASVLRVDGKNYHAWSHRQWMVSTLDLEAVYNSELDFTSQLIQEDIRNNSAWNHRWFIVHNKKYTEEDDQNASAVSMSKQGKQLPESIVGDEASYALSQIQVEPNNESSCRYLVALLKEHVKYATQATLSETKNSLLSMYLQELSKVMTEHEDAAAVLASCVDLYELDGHFQALASEVLTKLISVDPIRTKYWNFRMEQLEQK